MASTPRDENRVPGLIAESNDGNRTPVSIYADPTTHRLLVNTIVTGTLSIDDGGGSLTVDGAVSVSSITPGTTASSLGKAEDAAHVSGDVGVMMLGVRQDTAAATTSADGDYTPLTTSSTGALRVAGSSTHDNGAPTSLSPIGLYANATAPTNVSTDGDAVRAWALLNGSQVVNIASGGTLITGDGTNGLDVDVTRLIPGTTATALGKAEDTAHASGDTGVMSLAVRTDTPANKSGTDGDYEPLQVSSGLLWTQVRGFQTPLGDSAMDDTNDALRVNVVAGSTSGTQYTEGDIDTTITGTALMWEDASDTLRAVSTTKPLPVDLQDTSVAVTHDALTELAAAINSNKVDVNIASGSSAGTEYTEDVASVVDPAGGMLLARRRDTLSATEVSADGDNIALNATNKGQLHVKLADTVTVDGSAVTQPVSAASLPLPTGAATSAKQDTIIGHVDGIEGLLTTIDTDTGNINTDTTAIKTATELIDDAIVADDAAFTPATTKVMMAGYEFDDTTPDSVNEGDAGAARMSANRNVYTQIRDAAGNERGLNVDANGEVGVSAIRGALPTGSNAIGKLAANSGVDIGDVDVNSVVPGTGATSLGKAEDAVHASGDVGVMTLGVRNDAGTAFGADGDYVPLSVDASGAVRVTGGGGGTQYTEDAAAAADPVGTALTLVRNDARSGSLTTTDGDNVAARGTNSGELYVKHVDSIPITDNGGSLTVDNGGTFAVQATVAAVATNIAKAEDAASADADVGVPSMAVRKATPANTSGTDGDYEMLQMSAGRLWTSATVDAALPAGTNAIGKLAANSGVDIGDVDVTTVTPGTGAANLGKAEDAAHASGDVGVAAWGVRADTPNATVAADGDYHYLSTDKVGGIRTALYETDFAVLGTSHVKKYYTNAGAVTDGIVWSPAAGKRWYVTDIFINVSAAATVTLEDDLAAGDSAVWKAELATNSGWSHTFSTPLFSGEDAADLLVTTTAGNVYVTVVGYEI